MVKYKIIREDWFDHEDTIVGYYDSLEEARKALESIHKSQASITGPKDYYRLYEIPPDGHDPISYAQWHGLD